MLGILTPCQVNWPYRLFFWEFAVRLAVVDSIFDDVFLCCPFSHKIS